MAVCYKGITQFYLPPTHEPYLPLFPSGKASPPCSWYSLRLPTKGWPGCVDLGGWSHTEIKIPHRELNTDTVTHPSTNRARRRLTSLIETNALALRHHQYRN